MVPGPGCFVSSVVGRSAGADRDRGADRSAVPLAALIGAVMVMLLPLVVDPFGFQQHVALRWLLLGAAIGVGCWSVRRRLWEQTAPLVLWAWSAVLATTILAAVQAVVPFHSVVGESHRRWGVLSLALTAGAFALGLAVHRRRDIVFRAAPVATVVLLVAVAASLATQGLMSARSVLVGNAGQLGGYLVILAGVNLLVMANDPDHRWRRAGVVGVVLALGLVPVTGSYAAVLGGAALLLLATFTCGAESRARWLPVAAVGGAVALVAVAVGWPAQFRAVGTSIQGRVDTWMVSLDVIRSRPVVGWGPEGFRHGFALVVPESFVSTWGDLRVQDRVHSFPLDHAAATGVLGLVALVLLVAAVGASIVRYGSRQDRALGVVLVAAGVFLTGWFLEFDLAALLALLGGTAATSNGPRSPSALVRGLKLLVFVAAGAVVVIGLIALVEDQRFRRGIDEVAALMTQDAVDGIDRPGTGKMPDIGAVARGAFVPTAGYVELLVVVELLSLAALDELEDGLVELNRMRPWRDATRDAEIALVRAELALERARRLGTRQAFDVAEAAFDDVLVLAPHHSYAWRGLATTRLLAQNPAASEALVTLAVLRPQDAGVLHDLALVALQQGDPDSAVTWLEDACALAPLDEQLQRLAAALRVTGQAVPSCEPNSAD